MAFTPNGDHWRVNALLEGGNAERAGLRQGDRIEAINGITKLRSRKKSVQHSERIIMAMMNLWKQRKQAPSDSTNQTNCL